MPNKFNPSLRLKFLSSIILFIFALVSCTKVTEEETLWQLKSTPVVFSIISPSQTVQVSISKTIVKGEKFDTIYYPSARIFVCGEDKNWVELTRQSTEKAIYVDINKKIEVNEGKTYFMRMDLPNQTITAQTTVPLHQSIISKAEYIVDKDFPDSLNYYWGTLYATLQLNENYQCLLLANSLFIGLNNGTFINTESIKSRFVIQDKNNSFELKLISFDPSLAKYWAAINISVMQHHYEGDITVFLGTYNGLLPPYSNIVNGIGLFGSYVTDTKTVNISKP